MENSLLYLCLHRLIHAFRYTSKMLLAAIDENHRGTYDFIYLPIDFKVCILVLLCYCGFLLTLHKSIKVFLIVTIL